MQPWGKQKFLKGEKIPTVEDIIDMANSMDNDAKQCLFVLAYLTAGRVEELVRYKGFDTTFDKEGKGKKTLNGIERPSIKKGDLQIVQEQGRNILLINLKNLKNKTRKRKDIPVPLDIKENAILYNMIIDYLNQFGMEDELLPINYPYAYSILIKFFNPHFIRHIRLTHLVTKYGYREEQLIRYAGWSDSRPAKNYIEMNWKDLLYH
jgi:integrase